MKTIIEETSVPRAIEKLKELYRDSEVCLAELLATVEIHGLPIEDVMFVVATVMNDIEGDLIIRVDPGNGYATVIGR